jgi:hypothetical protein
MVVQVATSGSTDAESSIDSSDSDLDVRDRTFEPVRPATAERCQLLALAPPLVDGKTLAGGLAAVTLGGVVGYWLSRRRATPSARQMRRTVARVEAAADLAPLAIRLLSNPVVRAFVVRIILRQISRRIGR